MAIVRREVWDITCDVCGKECREDDGEIRVKVNNGDGRDVGPATISGRLMFNQPYGCSNGIVCANCKRKWLTKYLAEICPTTGDDKDE